MKYLLCIFALVVSFSAHSQPQDVDQVLKDGYLGGCWTEAGAGTVDGTFILRFKFTPLASGLKGKALADAKLKHFSEIDDAETAMRTSSYLVLIGRPLPIQDMNSEFTSYIVQADFAHPGIGSRAEIKELVAKDLLVLAKMPTMGGVRCLNRSPFRPSVTGSN
jgi:hypothetical protein